MLGSGDVSVWEAVVVAHYRFYPMTAGLTDHSKGPYPLAGQSELSVESEISVFALTLYIITALDKFSRT